MSLLIYIRRRNQYDKKIKEYWVAEYTKGKFSLTQEEGYDKTIAIPDCSGRVEKFMPEFREDGESEGSDDSSQSADGSSDDDNDDDESGSSSASKKKTKGKAKKHRKSKKSKKAKKDKKRKAMKSKKSRSRSSPDSKSSPDKEKESSADAPRFVLIASPDSQINLKSLLCQPPKALENASEVMKQLLRIQARAEVSTGKLEKMSGAKASKRFSFKMCIVCMQSLHQVFLIMPFVHDKVSTCVCVCGTTYL